MSVNPMAIPFEKPDISVIVPVYNVENYLEACLNSLVSQTAESLEIIAVNDGSTDSSPEILAEYEKKNANIRVIHQKNAGLSAARNTGIWHSKGSFIGFLDSDDFADHNAYKTLLKIAAEHKADIVKSGILIFKDKTNTITDLRQKPDMTILADSPKTTLKKYLQGELNTVVWDGIYRRDLFRDFEFPLGRKFEDHYYTPNALLRCETFCQTSDVLFYYRKREGAITNMGDVKGKIDKIQSLNELYRVLQKIDHPEEFAPLFSEFFLNMATDYHNSLIYSDPFKLRRKNHALRSVINPEVIAYILNHGNLSDKSNNALKAMRRSHLIFFLTQKTKRVYELIRGGNSETKVKQTKNPLKVLAEKQQIYKYYLDMYA